jgi:arginine decarboxylase
MDELGYTGGYTSVYPIKVNQHFGVAGELVAQGGEASAWRPAPSPS